jgi:6-phosphogluconolactonase
MTSPDLQVCDTSAELAHRSAQFVLRAAQQTLATRPTFTFAVSGGRTPWAMFAELAALDFPWESTQLFQVDERVAPDGDDARNLTHLLAAVPSTARVIPMPVTEPDLDAAAAGYAEGLPAAFDLIHLGIGPDGHTASLVPDDPVLSVTDRDVALTEPYQGHRRMTLTYPVLDRAANVLWLVSGSDKVHALRKLMARDTSVPAGRVRAPQQTIVADRSAVDG